MNYNLKYNYFWSQNLFYFRITKMSKSILFLENDFYMLKYLDGFGCDACIVKKRKQFLWSDPMASICEMN